MRDRQTLKALEIGRLLYLEMVGELSNAEREKLNEWRYSQQGREADQFIEKHTEWAQLEKDLRDYYAADPQAAFDKVMRRIEENAGPTKELADRVARLAAEAELEEDETVRQTPGVIPMRIPLYKSRIFRIAAAAAVLGAVSIVGIKYFSADKSQSENILASATPHYKNDVAPGGNKALLTLDDGRQITLDAASQGELARQGNAAVVKQAPGQIAYNITNPNQPAAETTLRYNEVSVPRGGQYQVVLPDGSQVWLNAASSLRFPTSFSGKERKVELTGEAYFSIKKDQARPFKVVTLVSGAPSLGSGGEVPETNSSVEIEVLGTEFNLSTYSEDATQTATLINGSIRVKNGAAAAILKPHQQAVVDHGSPLKVESDVDIDQVVAWKDNEFVFESASLDQILHQLSRWYDVDFRYENGAKNAGTQRLSAKIKRDNNLSDILKVLELSGFRFDIDGRTIIVKS